MLRDIHVRVSDEQYEMLTALSKALKLSQANYSCITFYIGYEDDY